MIKFSFCSLLVLPVLLLLFNNAAVALNDNYLDRPEVTSFIDEMVTKHAMDREQIRQLFSQSHPQKRVLEIIQAPAEGKPWYEYRDIFLTDKRIQEGAEFWEANQSTLEHASMQYGVPVEIIVAIIGVETFYGRQTGGFPVFDTLVTLGFDYPPRSDFFRSELEEFLLLTKEESLNVKSIRDVVGSYAGAMGKGQFISSSYRAYAVDFDKDGKRDLWHSNADAIGSVANYFAVHGWDPGGDTVYKAKVQGDKYLSLLDTGIKPDIKTSMLAGHGISPVEGSIKEPKVSFFKLDQKQGPEYWIGVNNFYVITRYNRSPLYAMAVFQLSQEIRNAYERQSAK